MWTCMTAIGTYTYYNVTHHTEGWVSIHFNSFGESAELCMIFWAVRNPRVQFEAHGHIRVCVVVHHRHYVVGQVCTCVVGVK